MKQILFLLLLTPNLLWGSEHLDSTIFYRVKAPVQLSQGLKSTSATPSYFNFSYINAPAETQAACEYAALIIEAAIHFSHPINVSVTWTDELEEGVLGSSRSGGVLYNNQQLDPAKSYHLSLAENLLMRDLNDAADPDIFIKLNSTFSWYSGLDGITPGNQVDMVTVLLHEILHSLGFSSSFQVNEEVTTISWGVPFPSYLAYDDNLIDNNDQQLIDQNIYTNTSAQLLAACTNNNLFFAGNHAVSANNGSNVKIYAPTEYDKGSSISHLDDLFNSTSNALMTHSIANGTSIHALGTITIGMLKDIGWTMITTPLSNQTEESPITLFPNPAKENIFLSGNSLEPRHITIYNLMGQKVMEQPKYIMGNNLNISTLNKGIFLLEMVYPNTNTKSLFKFQKIE